MSVGLLALIDDIAGLARMAAASLDDIAGNAAKASAKSAGVVIDDTAVTPRYLTGLGPERELPIVGRIAAGSMRNKLLYLLPGVLLLSALAPWAITPLLMIGGAFLCYEGAEKVLEAIAPNGHEPPPEAVPEPGDPLDLEERKVAGAIRTDFILSAEIMTIALAALPAVSLWQRAAALAIAGSVITIGVYGVVALIVKADDIGLALARRPGSRLSARCARAVGRGLVRGMPSFLRLLGIVGTGAMIWVGGGIVLHGLAAFGLGGPAHWIEGVAEAAAHAAPVADGLVGWLVSAALSGVFGLALGAAIVPATHAIAPLWQRMNALRTGTPKTKSLDRIDHR